MVGPPFEEIPHGYAWGPGWIRIEVVRRSGKTVGEVDVYYYSPKKGHMIRSLRKASIFIMALHEYGGSEDAAFDAIGRRG
jgi:hypothetical protein